MIYNMANVNHCNLKFDCYNHSLFLLNYEIISLLHFFSSLMYGAEDPSIAAMVLDSPFSDLVDLMMELVDTYKFRLPKFTVSKSKFLVSVSCGICSSYYKVSTLNLLYDFKLFQSLSDKICNTIYAESCSEESQF